MYQISAPISGTRAATDYCDKQRWVLTKLDQNVITTTPLDGKMKCSYMLVASLTTSAPGFKLKDALGFRYF
jgi:hypothetical protein